MKLPYFIFLIFCFLFTLSSCSVSHQLSKSADKLLLKDSVISTGHIGISIYEPATNSYWYNYDAAKYFVPASNVKLFTCYAGMKYLGDSLAGLRYLVRDSAITIYPTGDPTFLHSAFTKQPVFEFLKKYKRIAIRNTLISTSEVWGNGWAWDDYNESYMASRSTFPMYGNLIKATWVNKDSIFMTPSYFVKNSRLSMLSDNGFHLSKNINSNDLYFSDGNEKIKYIPFNYYDSTVIQLLSDTLKNDNIVKNYWPKPLNVSLAILHSQPTDSLLKPMMHRSDNFFAEQTLLMVSNEHLGYMNDEAIIDTLLKTDLKDIPQKPKWVDGCGLSRYNLFTPQSFVYILNKMKNEFGMERLKVILPTGGEGTLKNYYLSDSGYIYAKTGSLSNNISLSGFLTTKKNKQLIFSILLNNFQGDASAARRSIQSFIEGIREKY